MIMGTKVEAMLARVSHRSYGLILGEEALPGSLPPGLDIGATILSRGSLL